MVQCNAIQVVDRVVARGGVAAEREDEHVGGKRQVEEEVGDAADLRDGGLCGRAVLHAYIEAAIATTTATNPPQ